MLFPQEQSLYHYAPNLSPNPPKPPPVKNVLYRDNKRSGGAATTTTTIHNNKLHLITPSHPF
ncbi:uncharacterized protein H6S33_008535 [Morchella sextelata]|uniref:uncharacterized protein n=1 Tax=Morchella sextelata TaxID=1174677 RepID=UPI001D054710|nr:uncharacterized protein H6S33_008535 [Morchella sextelata]KAH0602885.1 hypothetical protein H6S33_008535 [Morchella sextelata]